MKLGKVLLAATLLLVPATTAAANTKSFIIEGPDLRAPNGGSVSAGSEQFDGVNLDDSGFGQVTVNFTLPADYKKNSPVTIALRMYGGGTSCNVHFSPDFVYRFRLKASRTIGFASNGQLTGNGPDTFARPADFGLVQSRSYTLRRVGSGALTTGSIRDQRAGDSIIAAFGRNGSFALDTCTGTLHIISAKITYTTN
jgi:hypothetical protein